MVTVTELRKEVEYAMVCYDMLSLLNTQFRFVRLGSVRLLTYRTYSFLTNQTSNEYKHKILDQLVKHATNLSLRFFIIE